MNKKEQRKALHRAYWTIKDVVEVREEYYEDKSEQWQEGNQGESYQSITESIDSVAESIRETAVELQ